MKRILLTVITITILLGSCAGIDDFDKPEQLSELEYSEDWNVFREILTSFHPAATAWHTEDELNSHLDRLEKKIGPEMTYEEFYALIWEGIDFIGDGHTAAMHPDWYYEQPFADYFPLYLTVIDNELYNLEEGTEIPFGSRITEIDGLSSAEVLNELGIYTASDGTPAPNETELLNIAFADYYTDHFGPSDSYSLGWEAPYSNKVEHSTVKAWSIDEDAGADDYLEIESFEYRELKNKRAYLGVHSFVFGEDEYTGSPEEWEEFLHDTFTALKENKTEELILDLRQNGGGDPLLMAQLLSYLIDERFIPEAVMFTKTQSIPMSAYIMPSQKRTAKDVEAELRELTKQASDGTFRYINDFEEEQVWVQPQTGLLFTGRLKVLVSPMTFSAGSMCAAILEDRTEAITIGRETCGGMTRLCAAADFQYRLPKTGISLDIPTVGIIVNLKNNNYTAGRGVIPDIIVENRAQLIIEGKDPEMQAALSN